MGRKPQNFEDTFELTEGGAMRPLFDRTVDTTTVDGVAEYADELLEGVRAGVINSNMAKNLAPLLAVQLKVAELKRQSTPVVQPAVPQIPQGTTGMQLFRAKTVEVLERIPIEGEDGG